MHSTSALLASFAFLSFAPAFAWQGSAFGTGVPGCTGPHEFTLLTAPVAGCPDFGWRCNRAPANSIGLLLVGDLAALGPNSFGIGVPIFVDLLNSTILATADVPSDASGVSEFRVIIPNQSPFVGMTFASQELWAWPIGPTCTPALGNWNLPFGLSATNGLSFTVQPLNAPSAWEDLWTISETTQNSLIHYCGCNAMQNLTYTHPSWLPAGNGRYGAFDPSKDLWILDVNLSRIDRLGVTYYPPSVTLKSSIPLPPGISGRGLTFTGNGRLYVVGSGQVMELSPQDGTILSSWSAGGSEVHDITWNSVNGLLYVSIFGFAGVITEHDPNTNSMVRALPCPGPDNLGSIAATPLGEVLVVRYSAGGMAVHRFNPALPAALAHQQTYSIPGATNLHGIDASRNSNAFYVRYVGSLLSPALIKVDMTTGATVATTPILSPSVHEILVRP